MQSEVMYVFIAEKELEREKHFYKMYIILIIRTSLIHSDISLNALGHSLDHRQTRNPSIVSCFISMIGDICRPVSMKL